MVKDKERLEELESESFADLEKIKVNILKEKIRSGIDEFAQDTKRQWTALRFEEPLLVKLLSSIEQAERVRELEERNKFLEKAHRINVNIAEDMKEERNRYREAIERIKEAPRKAHSGSDCVGIIFEIIEELESDEG